MRPDNDSSANVNTPLAPQPAVEPVQTNSSQQQAAAQVVRSQIDAIYDSSSPVVTPATDPTNQLESVNPYDRTHSTHPQPEADQWKQYHSAWQNYYQKYYEGYYTHHLQQAMKPAQATASTSVSTGYFSSTEQLPPADEAITKDEALFDLRQKLLSKVQTSAKKIRSSRHFIPIAAAVIVVLAFAFLQYNRVLISNVMAYVTPGSIDPQNIVVDPNADLTVAPEPRLIIPKINVDVPVIYDIGNDYNSQMAAMQKGVAHFAIPGASSHPGQNGNTVISGHSSNDLLDPGDYKFIFAQLDKLAIGDTIYANYSSKRYTYTITKKEVVKPNEVNKLVYATTKPVLTLITCTPLGTSTNRLLVTAEQVSPDPSAAPAAPADTGDANKATLPGNSPTFLERIFGS